MSIHEFKKAWKYYKSVFTKQPIEIQEKLYWEYKEFVYLLQDNKEKWDKQLFEQVISFKDKKGKLEEMLN